MMVLLVQCALGAVLLLSTYVVVGLLHGSWLLAGVIGFALIGILWFVYLVWQSQHPAWWAPWDVGLPQTTRVSNAFIPVLIIFIFVLMLAPVAQQAKRKSLVRRQRALKKTMRQQPARENSEIKRR